MPEATSRVETTDPIAPIYSVGLADWRDPCSDDGGSDVSGEYPSLCTFSDAYEAKCPLIIGKWSFSVVDIDCGDKATDFMLSMTLLVANKPFDLTAEMLRVIGISAFDLSSCTYEQLCPLLDWCMNHAPTCLTDRTFTRQGDWCPGCRWGIDRCTCERICECEYRDSYMPDD